MLDFASKIGRSIRINRQVDDILDDISDACDKNSIFINGGKKVTVTELLTHIFERNLVGKSNEERITNTATLITEVLKFKKYDGHFITKEEAIELSKEIFKCK